MTRPLLIVFACAMIVCFASFVAASAIGPMPHRWWSDHVDMDMNDGDFGLHPVTGGGPPATREIAWTGGDELNVNIPATVVYTQGPEARIVISGPSRTVERVELDDDTLRFDRRVRDAGRLTVTMTAPDVSQFNLHGSQRLTIAAFAHDRLAVNVFGSGDVTGAGAARRVELNIFGAGDVDLGAVTAQEAEISIHGSGDATASPTQEAEVNIMGSGDVTLTTRPGKLDTKIAGSGRVVQAEPEPPAPAAPKAGAV